MDMYRRMMWISWREHRTNNSIIEELQPTCRFLAEVKRRKLQYFGHVVRADNLCTHILHGTIAGNRRRGRPRRRWTDDIKQWTGIPVADCVQRARDMSLWRSLVSVSVTSDPQTWGRTKIRQEQWRREAGGGGEKGHFQGATIQGKQKVSACVWSFKCIAAFDIRPSQVFSDV